MKRTDIEKEVERARRLRALSERALKRSQEACDRAEDLKRFKHKKLKKEGGKAETA